MREARSITLDIPPDEFRALGLRLVEQFGGRRTRHGAGERLTRRVELSHTDGVRIGRNFGTYLHGAFESAELLSELLGRPIAATPSKQQNYARLADWFSRHQRGFEEMYL